MANGCMQFIKRLTAEWMNVNRGKEEDTGKGREQGITSRVATTRPNGSVFIDANSTILRRKNSQKDATPILGENKASTEQ